MLEQWMKPYQILPLLILYVMKILIHIYTFFPEVPEHYEVLYSGARYEANTQNTSDYDTTMDLYVSNIYKNDKNAWSTIYEVIYER